MDIGPTKQQQKLFNNLINYLLARLPHSIRKIDWRGLVFMAERIDKDEYVDNSKVFFDFLRGLK